MRRWIQLIMLASVFSAAPVLAEEESTEEEKAHQFTVTPAIYKRLSEAHESIQKNKLDAAMPILEDLLKKRLNDHEKSLVLQAKSHIYAARDKYGDAAKTLEECIALNALPKPTLLQSRYNLGQLYLALQQVQKAIGHFSIWLKEVEKPAGGALYTIAVAYTQAKQTKPALTYAQQAVSSTSNPQDSWLQLLLSLQFEAKQYGPAINTLKVLIGRQPKKKAHWLQLASAYEELGDSKKALAAMELCYAAGLLERPDEYINLAQRMIAQRLPQKGALILERTMKEKKVPENGDNLRLLANAWLYARNRKEALDTLDRLAKSDSTGKTNLRIAQIHMEVERWEAAATALKSAIAKGGLDNAGQAHLMLGTALVNQKRFDAARQALLEAKKFPDTESSAGKWLSYIDKQKDHR